MTNTLDATDVLIGRVINFVGLVLVVSLLIIGALAWRQAPIPDVLQNVAVGALTALAGLLVGRRTTA